MALAAILGAPATARAQDDAALPEEEEAVARSREAALDSSFGPLLVIEGIEITGNPSTARRLILRALPIAVGESLRAGDPRFREARFKLLATGYFREAELSLRKGSRPGHVVLIVRVQERGTVVLNSLHFGTSVSTPWWAGVDISERNLLGSGIALGAGGMMAARGDVAGARRQHGAELRVGDPSILGSGFGAHLKALHVRAGEPVRARGTPGGDGPAEATIDDFCTLPYTRAGGRAGLGVELSPLAHLSVDLRVERVNADLPATPGQPICRLDDGTPGPITADLVPGRSWVVSAIAGYDRDRRPDPVLPHSGDRLLLLAEVSHPGLGSDYEFVLLLARYGRWWPVRGKQHVLSLHLSGGLIIGQAPRFDRLHAVDFNRLLTPRSYGLLVSTTPPLDVLSTGADTLTYGELGGSAVVEYSYRLFRSRRYVYGGDLFVGAGIWGLAARSADPARSADAAFPVDLLLDAGLRLDTEIGIFELTFANALGRVPF